MTAAEQLQLVSVADYLSGETDSVTKHEYVGGVVYAMAGASNAHNRIATATVGALFSRLHGNPCEPFNSDTKIRIKTGTQTRFYYPDASVVCEPNSAEDSFQDNPVLIAEVLSPGTRRIDEGEKKDAYLAIPSLLVYLLILIEQDQPEVTVYRRADQSFTAEVYHGLDAVIPLAEFGIELPLAELYERIQFAVEPVDGES